MNYGNFVLEWLASHTWLCAWGSFALAFISFIIVHIIKRNKGNNMHIGNIGDNSKVNQSGGDINYCCPIKIGFD